MRSRKSMCKINPESTSCKHWQHRVCRRCADWTPQQDQRQDTASVKGQPKLITVEQCQRLRRELQTSLFNSQAGTNPMTVLMLLFFMGFTVFLILWLLAKAFLVRSPRNNEPVGICSDERRSGGHDSVDNIVRQLRESSAKLFSGTAGTAGKSNALYVPPQFWDKVSMSRLTDKGESVERANHLKADTSDEADDDGGNSSTEDSDDSDGSSEDDDDDDDSTSCSSNPHSMGSSFDEDESSITLDLEREAHRYYDAIGRMPVNYGLTTMNSTNCQAEGVRWANWLTRSKKL